MVVGLATLAIVVVYVTVWWFALKKASGWLKAVVILAALAIPFWDLPYGYSNF